MGLYQSNYVGPILLCKYNIIVKERRYPRCENNQCSAYRRRLPSDFIVCPQCSKPIGFEIIPFETPNVEHQDIFEVIGEKLAHVHDEWCTVIPEPYHIFIPNGKTDLDPPRDFHTETDHCCNLLSHIDYEKEKIWMAEAYSHEIEKLKTIYETVWTDWAMLVYFS